jgi:hypothetical protein
MFLAVLRRTYKHLDQVIVEAVEQLALEGPLELRVVEIARMQLEVVRVDRRIGETRTNDHLDRVALGAGVEFHQRVLVEAELVLHAGEPFEGHTAIVDDDFYSYRSASIGSSLEALIAGSMPLTNPTNPRMIVATNTIVGSIISRMSAASAFLAMAL